MDGFNQVFELFFVRKAWFINLEATRPTGYSLSMVIVSGNFRAPTLSDARFK